MQNICKTTSVLGSPLPHFCISAENFCISAETERETRRKELSDDVFYMCFIYEIRCIVSLLSLCDRLTDGISVGQCKAY